MANCRTCGAAVPFKWGGAKDQCEQCRKIHAAVSQPATQQQRPVGQSGAQTYSESAEVISPPANSRSALVAPPIWQSATGLLIAINVAVFVVMVLNNPNALMQPTNQQLIKWGADFGPLTLDNQPWRLITSGFLHIGIIHIAVNMWSLWILGKIAERFVGATSLVAIYILTGLGASLASLAWDPVRVSAGASGPIFGFIGAMIGILYVAKDKLDPVKRKAMLNWVVRIAVINLLIGLKGGIDNMAHAGGLVTGVAIGAALVITARNRTQDRSVVRRNIFLASAAVLALVFFVVRTEKHDIVYAYRGEVALENKDYPASIAYVKQYIAEKPNDPAGHATLGYVYQQTKRYPEALVEYNRSLAIVSDQPDVEVNMAIIYQSQGKTQEAIDLFAKNLGKVKFDADSYRAFGEALLQNREAERAEKQLRNAIKLDDKDSETHADLAQALRMQGKRQEADTEDSTAAELRKNASQKQVKP